MPARYVEAARAYLGTPWRHQARIKGLGIDCVGLLVCAARDAGLAVKDVTNYPPMPSGSWLVDELRAQLLPVSAAAMQLGDVLCFSWGRVPWHVGIVSSRKPLQMVHAWRQVDRCVEIALDDSWRLRICGVWRFLELAA